MTAPVAPVRLAPERLAEAAAVMGRAVGRRSPLRATSCPTRSSGLGRAPDDGDRSSASGWRTARSGQRHPRSGGSPAGSLPPIPSLLRRIVTRLGWQEVRAAWGREAVDRFQAFVADRDDAVGSLAPQPHWHLTWLGVEPGQQGQGIGSTLVRQMTTRADAEGMACWLFTFASRNVPIYEHLGFHVTLDTTLPPRVSGSG